MRAKLGRGVFAIALFSVTALLVLLLTPFIGIENVGFADILSESVKSKIFWEIRTPRVIIAFLAGSGLAISGMAFQAIFRNSLATPFTLGVASGGSLGAALYMSLGMHFTVLGVSGISISSLLGSMFAIALVYGLTRVRQGFTMGATLLAGVAVSFFFSSLILFLQYITDFTRSFLILRWLMGGLEVVGYDAVYNVAPFVVIGSGAIFLLSRELDLLSTGEDIAISRGVDAGRVKIYIFFSVSIMVGGIVAVCGPIGFVGLMAPHICRLIIGPDHRLLAPATIFFGGIFLTLCDTVARTIVAPAEIPVGVITSLLGGPFFLWLLVGGKSGARVR